MSLDYPDWSPAAVSASSGKQLLLSAVNTPIPYNPAAIDTRPYTAVAVRLRNLDGTNARIVWLEGEWLTAGDDGSRFNITKWPNGLLSFSSTDMYVVLPVLGEQLAVTVSGETNDALIQLSVKGLHISAPQQPIYSQATGSPTMLGGLDNVAIPAGGNVSVYCDPVARAIALSQSDAFTDVQVRVFERAHFPSVGWLDQVVYRSDDTDTGRNAGPIFCPGAATRVEFINNTSSLNNVVASIVDAS